MKRNKKNAGFKCKHMKPDEYAALEAKTQPELNEAFVQSKKHERAARKQKKEDHELRQLKEQLETAKKEHPHYKKMKKMREEIKELNKEMLDDKESGIFDLHEQHKSLGEGHQNLIKEKVETQKAILYILNKREH